VQESIGRISVAATIARQVNIAMAELMCGVTTATEGIIRTNGGKQAASHALFQSIRTIGTTKQPARIVRGDNIAMQARQVVTLHAAAAPSTMHAAETDIISQWFCSLMLAAAVSGSAPGECGTPSLPATTQAADRMRIHALGRRHAAAVSTSAPGECGTPSLRGIMQMEGQVRQIA
jgi:hypothetical protein